MDNWRRATEDQTWKFVLVIYKKLRIQLDGDTADIDMVEIRADC